VLRMFTTCIIAYETNSYLAYLSSSLQVLPGACRVLVMAREIAWLYAHLPNSILILRNTFQQHVAAILAPPLRISPAPSSQNPGPIERIEKYFEDYKPQIIVTVKSIILFGLWAKIPFPHLATSEIPTWVCP